MTTATRKRSVPKKVSDTLPAPTWDEVLANLSDAVLLIDSAGTVVFCNAAAENLLGLPKAQIWGRPYGDIFAASPSVSALLRRAQESTQSQTESAGVLSRPRSDLPVRVATSPLLDAAGQSRGAAVVIHDLRYERSLEEEVRRSEQFAQLAAVVAGLAHEIKNPLGGIKGAAQLLARQLDDHAGVRDYTDLIVREADRLSGLVEQLLGLGGLAPPQLAPLNVHRLIRDVLLLAQESPEAGGIHVQLQFDPSLPPVRGDERQLKQVLLNLVRNAMEAMGSSGTLTVTTRMETDFHIVRARGANQKFIRLEVADTGTGISPEHLARIFDPFFTTKIRGTGLGLAISHRIATAHGGNLHASSEPNRGAVMTLTLPMALD